LCYHIHLLFCVCLWTCCYVVSINV
jgi:hypothetical protein